MRKIVIAAYVLACCSPSSEAWAQNCKPDASETDKLTKEKYDLYAQVLSSKGGLMSTSNTTIMALAWRQANVNYIQLRVQKVEQSFDNAAFESTIRGAVGKPFYFGFKTGDPVALEVTSVDSAAGVSQGLFAAKGVTTTIFRAAVSDKALAALREALVSRQIDAVRIALAGDARIEVSVDDKSGQKMMGKFSCFYQSLDKKGIDLSAGVDPPAKPGQPASAAAKQAESQKPGAQLTIDQVIQMVSAKLADDIIMTTIRNSSSKFDLTPDALIKLKTAGVSDEVIRAMTK